ncbi:gamma-glutamyltransferase [Gammaproteobacteria bacterium 42_54_T18]|nr:gamma-glutamyltransferase [Gammaproteobacteria bacterium 42_54_T18]
MGLRYTLVFVAVTLLFTSGCQQSQSTAQTSTQFPAQASVASAHPLATQAGMDILAEGGNAFDAAIAVASVLGVVEPYSAGIGGGGFWLLHRAADGKEVMIDAREKAPLAATHDMYVNKKGKVNRDLAVNGPLSAGIPGQPAAFAHITNAYGTLPLNRTLKHAIHHADQGFQVDRVYLQLAAYREKVLSRFPESHSTLVTNNLTTDTVITQKDLARTLNTLATKGKAGFYQGPLAQQLVNGVTEAGGIWQLDDLLQYNVIERQPITFTYNNNNSLVKIVSAPPPSSGGVALAEMFNMLEAMEYPSLDPLTQHHVLVEVMRRAYRDRAEHLGDSDFYPVPVSQLIDPIYGQNLAKSINLSKATDSSSLGKSYGNHSGTHTTHLSVIDKHGNYVSATLSINLPFGSGFTVPGTGVLLNNEMDDFSALPGSPNAYGLVGSQANAIAPGKRPLSSMTPTFAEFTVDNHKQVAILGTPGGSRIITMVFLGLLEAIEGKTPEDWVSRHRFHHQYLPDAIQIEPNTFSKFEKAQLQRLGHKLKPVGRRYGNMQAILWNQQTGKVSAASDPRGVGEARVK